jgi:hypothetical protein
MPERPRFAGLFRAHQVRIAGNFYRTGFDSNLQVLKGSTSALKKRAAGFEGRDFSRTTNLPQRAWV